MIKIICDRCGKTITEEQEIGYIAWNFRESIRGELLHENEFEGKHYCPDCMDEIHAFISGGESSTKNAGGDIGEDSGKGAGDKPADDSASTNPLINLPQAPDPPKKSRRKIDIGKILALRDAGWTYLEIADEMEMSSAAVSQAVYAYRRKHERNEEA